MGQQHMGVIGQNFCQTYGSRRIKRLQNLDFGKIGHFQSALKNSKTFPLKSKADYYLNSHVQTKFSLKGHILEGPEPQLAQNATLM